MKALRDVRSAVRVVALFLMYAAVWVGTAFAATTGPEGVEWRLIEVNGAVVPTLAGGKQPSLKLDGAQKKVSGYSGCNKFFGTYERNGVSLKFGPVGASRRACEEPGNGIETALLQALERTRGWRVEEGNLLLLDGESVLARFIAATSGTDRPDPASMTYRLRSLPAGPVALTGGAYRAPATPGSASEVTVTLTDKQAFGTVQGRDAAAVILVVSLGGTGSFYELALITKGAHGWENSDTILIGDRVKVRSLAIRNDDISVALTTPGPKDPLCCPTWEVTKTYLVQNGRLMPPAEGGPATVLSVKGTTWQWVRTRYNNDTTAVPAKPENYTIRFLDNGGIEIKADCNLKSGTYSLEGKALSIAVQRATMAICEPGSLNEQFTRDLLAGAVLFMKDGDLFIDLKYDSGTMRFSGK